MNRKMKLVLQFASPPHVSTKVLCLAITECVLTPAKAAVEGDACSGLLDNAISEPSQRLARVDVRGVDFERPWLFSPRIRACLSDVLRENVTEVDVDEAPDAFPVVLVAGTAALLFTCLALIQCLRRRWRSPAPGEVWRELHPLRRG